MMPPAMQVGMDMMAANQNLAVPPPDAANQNSAVLLSDAANQNPAVPPPDARPLD